MDSILSLEQWRPAYSHFITGLAVHQVIRRTHELDAVAGRISLAYFLALGALFVFFALVTDLGGALSSMVVITSSFNAGLFGGILVYRAFFHRLHHFPGPFAAKLSRFYRLFRDWSRLTAHLEDQKLHETYGDFVRVGPREISVNRPSAVQIIYGPTARCLRGPWYRFDGPDSAQTSLMSDPSPESHKLRRKAWEQGLSFRALQVYEPRVAAKTDLLIDRIAKHEGMPLNATQLSMFFGFDVMGDIGYSKEFHMLESGEEVAAVADIHNNMVIFGLLGSLPWLLNIVLCIPQGPSARSSGSDFSTFCADQVEEKRKVVKSRAASDEQPCQDVMSWLVKSDQEIHGTAPRKGVAMAEDSRLMVIAGSDTASVALANALYFLTKNPKCHHKLQRLLDEELPRGEDEWSHSRVKNVPYLDYIIQETLRLRPSALGALARLTPPEGIWIDEVFIPGDTIVSIPPWTIHRDPRYWEDAQEFVPERWEGLSTEKAPWIAFTKGRYACPGRNLAMMELRMALSRIALRYNTSFVCEDDAEKFDGNTKDVFTLGISPLPLLFTRR